MYLRYLIRVELGKELKIYAIADGTRDNWDFLECFGPEVALNDFWHVVGYLKDTADAAFGLNCKENTAWFKKHCDFLRESHNGVGKVIDVIRYLRRKGKGGPQLDRVLVYFRNGRRWMNYRDAIDSGNPIGSGPVEAVNKVLAAQRMKRRSVKTGDMTGGRVCRPFRASHRSGCLDRAWADGIR